MMKKGREWFVVSFKPENFIPGLIIGFIFGLFWDLSKPAKSSGGKKIGGSSLVKKQQQSRTVSSNTDEELKMVLIVRQDLRMGAGKIASQCAHAATGMYSELMQSLVEIMIQLMMTKMSYDIGTSVIPTRLVSPSISSEKMGALRASQNSCYVQESTRNVSRNKLRDAAETIGLPTFTVADAGRTQVSAGSKTVLAIGPA
ncbi:hypothetical protein OROGR_010799 [Orobanche gracilis]